MVTKAEVAKVDSAIAAGTAPDAVTLPQYQRMISDLLGRAVDLEEVWEWLSSSADERETTGYGHGV